MPNPPGEITELVGVLADGVRKYAAPDHPLVLDLEAMCLRVAEIEDESVKLNRSLLELSANLSTVGGRGDDRRSAIREEDDS